MTPSHSLTRLAGEQEGVVHTDQLLGLGFTLADVRGG
jgi:hypothetical protein